MLVCLNLEGDTMLIDYAKIAWQVLPGTHSKQKLIFHMNGMWAINTKQAECLTPPSLVGSRVACDLHYHSPWDCIE